MLNQCNRSFVQEYQCQILILDTIPCDKCLAPEIITLNYIGIKTIGSCCAQHINTRVGVNAYIQVIDEHVNKMIELGYELLPVDVYGNGLNCFKPQITLPKGV